MSDLIYKNSKFKGLKIFIFIIIAIVLVVATITTITIKTNEFARVFPFLIFSVSIFFALIAWFIYRPLKYSRNVELYDDHVLIESKSFSWKDILEVKQLKNGHFFEISYLNEGIKMIVILNNEFSSKELFILNSETDLVKKIKDNFNKMKK